MDSANLPLMTVSDLAPFLARRDLSPVEHDYFDHKTCSVEDSTRAGNRWPFPDVPWPV